MKKRPLSEYDLIFWYEYLLNPNSATYNIKFVQDINGNLDVSQLNKALSQIIEDYPVFNSHVLEKQNNCFWEKNSRIEELQEVDNTNESIDSFLHNPFLLDQGPLYRFGIVKLKKDSHRLLIVFHHIILVSYSPYAAPFNI